MLKRLSPRPGVLLGIVLLLFYLSYRIYESNVDATTLRKAMRFVLAVHVPIAGLALLPLPHQQFLQSTNQLEVSHTTV